ncbi:MAG: ABC transporter substrate-binding protein [Bdellovibrionota bacterium]
MNISKFLRFFLLTALFVACTRVDPRDEKAVHLSLPARVKSLDPIQGNDLYSIIQSSYAYEPLLEYHYLKRPYVLIPRLASAMPEIGRDKITYTFHLRPGVHFADDPAFPLGKGREITAQDFVYSWKRLADPKNAAGGWWLLDGKIAGLNEWRERAVISGKADYAENISGLFAPDSRTLTVKLSKPNALFLNALAIVPTSVVAKEAVEKYGAEFGQHAVGTGPYRLTENGGGTKFVWDRNPTFRASAYPAEGEAGDAAKGLLADAGQPLPRNDRIVTQVNEESLPAWLGFLAGKLDLSSIPKDSFGQAVPAGGQLSPELTGKGIRLFEFPEMDLTRVSFNMADPLLGKNKLLRQALSLAFDTGPLIKTFYNGQAVPSVGPIPPGIPGFDPNLKNPYREVNLEKAKTLLARAGYPGGKGLPPIEFVSVAGGTSRQLTDYIERQFAPLGVKLKTEAYSWPEYTKRVMSKRGQMWSFGWMPFYPDADNFLQLFYGKNAAPGPNDMNYVNSHFDSLYEKARSELDEKKRVGLYKEMVKIVIEDTPCIFGVHRTDHYLAQPWLKNLKLHNFAPDQAKYLRVEGRVSR